MPNQEETLSSDSFENSDTEDVFDKTQSNDLGMSFQRLKTIKQPKKEKGHPILPHGMTLKALYDDVEFDKWFKNYFRDPPKTFEMKV